MKKVLLGLVVVAIIAVAVVVGLDLIPTDALAAPRPGG